MDNLTLSLGLILVCAQGYSASSGRFIGLGCGHGSFSRTLAWGNNIGCQRSSAMGVHLVQGLIGVS